MGQDCCYPAKDANSDLRGRASRKRDIKNNENTFRQRPEVPEFTVTRKDSLCMAARDHTEKMLNDGHRDSVLVDSAVDTNGIKSVAAEDVNQQEEQPCFSAGTFAVANEVSREHANVDQYQFLSADQMLKPKESLAAVSFGAAEESMLDQQNDSADAMRFGPKKSAERMVDLSIRDIQEVRDKVPASPATPLVEPKQQYFE